MASDYSIVRQDRFIEATRDSGYKGTDSALSELIDNSIQAGATAVTINMLTAEPEPTGIGRPAMPRVVEVAIGDNGRGMSVETLRRALRFGDSSRFNDRTSLGRFGMGLPNASVSQCTRVEVYSWRRGCKPIWTYVDVDEISKGKMTEVPEPREAAIPPAYAALFDSPSGTVVIWKKPDRLDHDQRCETLIRHLRPSLGRIFRYFLIQDFELTINGAQIGPFDPLYLLPQARLDGDLLATKHGDTLTFDVPIPGQPGQISAVEVTISLLPEEWQVRFGPGKTKDQKEALRLRQIETTAGFSVVRANREIDLIHSPYHARHWKDRWYRVEIRFEPELDEVFGVTHTKQHARIVRGSPLFNQMETAIKANVNTLLDIIEHRKPTRRLADPTPAEELVKRIEPRLKPLEGIEDKPSGKIRDEINAFIQERVAAGATGDVADQLDRRLSQFPVIVELEQLPGAPVYRIKVVGRTIVVMLNTAHPFYERVYQRLEEQSNVGKTGVDLLLMSLARSEVGGSDEAREWYDAQRQNWSQNLKLFTLQLPEFEREANGSGDDK
ncbi:MAG TPA: ATP-binding protein [Pirellulales bacterium]|jgi:hypothetical protein|nr:ATP-binding protein [Pirellulales bacterium]